MSVVVRRSGTNDGGCNACASPTSTFALRSSTFALRFPMAPGFQD